MMEVRNITAEQARGGTKMLEICIAYVNEADGVKKL
jgi:hypothetical protein